MVRDSSRINALWLGSGRAKIGDEGSHEIRWFLVFLASTYLHSSYRA